MTSDKKHLSSTEVQDHLRAPVGFVKKCVGNVPAVGRFEHEAKSFESQLRAMTVTQLQDTLKRQNAILNNPGLLKTLPDKGEKVKKRKEMIEELINVRQKSLNDAIDLMNALSLNGTSKKVDVDEMEWKLGGGNLFRNLDPTASQALDSDDDPDEEDSNPLSAIANTNVPNSNSKLEFEKEADDLVQSLAPFAEKLSHKSDESKSKARFMPFLSVDQSTKTAGSGNGLQRRAKSDRPIRDHKVEVMPLQNEKSSLVTVKQLPMKEAFQLEKEHHIKLFD